MKKQQEKTIDSGLLDYIETLRKDPEERKAMQKLVNKEVKKLSKNKKTQFAALFMSAIKFD